ncbi:nicotinate-nucleotide--dimethylbenzimidazole phosphoribosyltransferase [Alicyclobacillus shizuokensis]|uniref:nicotinate-nucleotide--dimethylbenzimidazole phosphoribosyltransferase n=1 Tax=Alicyclobacillus shizuokensis TaxID=392014 RepID=UPI000834ADF9|nr:nicotinate-nucleotide--dimethylbenzimidazole phosphoribosyltransferase [Alicyclobacillus shizuokensis]
MPVQSVIQDCLDRIRPVSSAAADAARLRLDRLTKPLGSLGRLEDVMVRVAAMVASPAPRLEQPTCLVFAADHGVAAEGVSAYPQEVTAQMAVNIASGGAVSSVLARQHQVRLQVVDVGVTAPLRHPGILNRRVRAGTRNFTAGPAMTRSEAEAAVCTGIDTVNQAHAAGCGLLLVGEMGIANTTPAAAMAAVLGQWPVSQVVGTGTGISKAQWEHKVHVIERALDVNHPDAEDPWQVLAALGGLEIAALGGAILAAAAHRMPVLLDGLMTGVAALWACRLAADVKDYLLASHVSAEPGHRMVISALGLQPLLDLELRLGEASGALLALPLLLAAQRVFTETATFEEAGVSEQA